MHWHVTADVIKKIYRGTEGNMIRTYKFRLYPTEEQMKKL
ncbi:MAG TPA: helix-turn-helix domain-containing protein [Nitrososphaera sp.]|nr:helix-turn-helix domain-containing protein [Nitrososphaera sp.]